MKDGQSEREAVGVGTKGVTVEIRVGDVPEAED